MVGPGPERYGDHRPAPQGYGVGHYRLGCGHSIEVGLFRWFNAAYIWAAILIIIGMAIMVRRSSSK